MHKFRLFLLIGAMLLGGCSAFPVNLHENDAVGDSSPHGKIIFSVAIDEKELLGMDHLWLTFQRADRAEVRGMIFDLKDHRFANVFSSGAPPSGAAVRVVILQLPVGKYRLLGWKGYAAGQRRHHWLLRSPDPGAERGADDGFPYQFSVQSDATSYLGRIELTTQQGEYRGVRILDQMSVDLEMTAGRLAGGMASVSKALLIPEH